MGEQRVPTIRRSLLNSDEALYDGVKPWMMNSVRNWLEPIFSRKINHTTYYSNDLIHRIELHARINLGSRDNGYPLHNALMGVFISNENYALDILQATVELCSISPEQDRYDYTTIGKVRTDELNRILHTGGSKWHVVVDGSKARLEARVNQVTTSAYAQLIASSEDYAPLLKKSWEYCYGRDPSPSETYTFAIRATEAASWRVVTPNNPKSTLGTIIRDLDTQHQAGKFENAFNDISSEDTFQLIILAMNRLWQSQTDRHATGTFVEPSPTEAEAAVHLAILICHFFSRGSIRRKTV